MLDKRSSLAFLTESQVFEQQKHGDGKRIIDHGHINVSRIDSCFGEGAWPCYRRSGSCHVRHLRDMRVCMAFAAS